RAAVGARLGLYHDGRRPQRGDDHHRFLYLPESVSAIRDGLRLGHCLGLVRLGAWDDATPLAPGARPRLIMRTRPTISLWHLPLLLGGVTMLLPLTFMFVTALARPGEAMAAVDSVIDFIVPRSWRWENFAEVNRLIPF